MSDHSWSVVRLDIIAPADALQIGERLRDVLLARGVMVANDRFQQAFSPSAWKPGPAVHEALMDPAGVDEFLTLGHNGVDIYTDRRIYDPDEAAEPPHCARCAEEAPSSYTDSQDWLYEWTDGREPTLQCQGCGWSGLVGDWDGTFATLVGAPAVTFFNWATLSPAFVADVRGCLGGRTGLVFAHY